MENLIEMLFKVIALSARREKIPFLLLKSTVWHGLDNGFKIFNFISKWLRNLKYLK